MPNFSSVTSTLFIFWLILPGTLHSAGFAPNRYAESTFQSFENDYDPSRGSEPGMDHFMMKPASLLVTPVYLGHSRPIGDSKREFIDTWADLLGKESFADLYKSEIAVREGKTVRWLPVQDRVQRHIPAELEKGSQFQAYLRVLGRRDASDSVPVYVMIEFRRLEAGTRFIPTTDHSCPKDTVLVDEPFQTGHRRWCEKRSASGQAIKHGLFVQWFSNGQRIYQGNFVDGLEEGTWTTWNSDGSRNIEYLFKSGKVQRQRKF